MSLLLLGKHNVSIIQSSRHSLSLIIGKLQQRLPSPLHSLHNCSASKQHPRLCATARSAAPADAEGLHMQDLDEKAVDLVRQIHGTNRKAVFYVAGGGVQVSFVLLRHPSAFIVSLQKHLMHFCIALREL